MDTTGTDRGTVRLIIIAILVLALLVAAGIVYIVATNTGNQAAVPEQLWLIETALVSCLITLATTRSKPDAAPAEFHAVLEQLEPGAMNAGAPAGALNPPHDPTTVAGPPAPAASENPGKPTRVG